MMVLFGTAAFAQQDPVDSESITLEQFVADLKSKNESIRDAKVINVMVNDLLIENVQEYSIDPKNIAKMEILVLEPKDAAQRRNNPSIIITTKRK